MGGRKGREQRAQAEAAVADRMPASAWSTQEHAKGAGGKQQQRGKRERGAADEGGGGGGGVAKRAAGKGGMRQDPGLEAVLDGAVPIGTRKRNGGGGAAAAEGGGGKRARRKGDSGDDHFESLVADYKNRLMGGKVDVAASLKEWM